MKKFLFQRILCLVLAGLILLPAAAARAESPSEIRVLLRRLNLTDRADLTLTGRYLARSADGKELLNQIVNVFPCPVSFRGLTASSGTVEMAYAYADGQQGHLMRQLAFTPEN